MAAEHTDAIVLRMVEFSETSLIVTLYTRRLGRVSAIAKGARRAKGPFEGAIDLLSVCRTVLITKASDALDILTEAKLERRFRAAQRSLVRLHCGYYLAELMRLWTDDGSPNPDLYDLLLDTITRVDGDEDALGSVLRFELLGLRLLGSAPATAACVSCGGSLNADSPRVPFAYDLGGTVCDACRPRVRHVASLRREAVGRLSELTSGGPADDFAARPELYRELRAILSRYVNTLLGNAPRTQSLLPSTWVSH